MKRCAIGIDIGGTKLATGLVEVESGNILALRRTPTPPGDDGDALCALLAQEVGVLLEEAGLAAADVLGIGIGAPSAVEPREGRVIHAPNLPALRDFPLAAKMQAYFPCPVRVDNDANLAALAEHRFGAGRGSDDLLYITISTGIGGGFILGGRLYHGPFGTAGEVGHMLATPGEGPLCGCGMRGCYEAYCSGAHLPERVQERLAQGATTCMVALAGGEADAVDGYVLAEALAQDDAMAKEIVAQIARQIGQLFYNVYQALGLSLFVVGGGLTALGDTLLCGIRREFEALLAHSPLPPRAQIRQAELRQDYGVIGAALLLCE